VSSKPIRRHSAFTIGLGGGGTVRSGSAFSLDTTSTGLFWEGLAEMTFHLVPVVTGFPATSTLVAVFIWAASPRCADEL